MCIGTMLCKSYVTTSSCKKNIFYGQKRTIQRDFNDFVNIV